MNFKLTVQDEQRFFAKVLVDELSGCWVWQGQTSSQGYGVFEVQRKGVRMRMKAHNVSFQLMRGVLCCGLVRDHQCDTPKCVNPGHLEQVTSSANTMRGHGVVVKNGKAWRCVNGHRFTRANTYAWFKPSGATKQSCNRCRRSRHINWLRRTTPTDHWSHDKKHDKLASVTPPARGVAATKESI